MLEDLRKSLRLVIQERITSPFSGAFFFSWFVWNWKLVYVLLFWDSNLTLPERFSFIETNLLDFSVNCAYPFISAVVLVGIYPFVTTGSLWVWLKFRKLQTDLRNKIEGQQLLTLEQSIALRIELQEVEARFDRLLKSKDDEIVALRLQVENVRKTTLPDTTDEEPISAASQENNYAQDYSEFVANPQLVQYFPAIMQHVQDGDWITSETVPSKVFSYLMSNDLIARKDSQQPIYEFTEKGKFFVKHFVKRTQ